MLGDIEIKLVRPNSLYKKSYLEAAKEFKQESRVRSDFLITKLSEMKRIALNIGILDFHKEITKFISAPREGKISFIYWIIINGEYAGEICIKDRLLENYPIKSVAKPQSRWNSLYHDELERFTTASILLRSSAKISKNENIINGLIFEKLEELGFDELVMNCSKEDKRLSYKIYQISCLCGGRIFETSKTIEYMIPVNSKALRDGILNEFIPKANIVEENENNSVTNEAKELLKRFSALEHNIQ